MSPVALSDPHSLTVEAALSALGTDRETGLLQLGDVVVIRAITVWRDVRLLNDERTVP